MADRKYRAIFAHAAYRLGDELARRSTDIDAVEVRDLESLTAQIPQADVLVVSGLWRDTLLDHAPRLRFIQSISAGTNQYGLDLLRARGVRLASAQGANAIAVAEHAIALLTSLSRHLHLGRDAQAKRFWRPMLSDPAVREWELAGRAIGIVGLGPIGERLARLANAFEMRVETFTRTPRGVRHPFADVHVYERLTERLPHLDVIALCCPLTPTTEGLIGRAAFAAMKPGAVLINVARGRVVDEDALIDALASGELAGAGLDCFRDEPLPAASPLWTMPQVIVTPHSAGETRAYEARVIDLLIENLGRLERGEPLVNDVV